MAARTRRGQAGQYTGAGIAIGAGLGVLVGVLLGGAGIAFGIAIGAGAGVAVGAALDARQSRPPEADVEDPPGPTSARGSDGLGR